MKKLTKNLINYINYAAQSDPPALPNAPKPAPIPLPSRGRRPTDTQNPPLPPEPSKPPEPIQIWPSQIRPIYNCEGKLLSDGWSFPTPPIQGYLSDPHEERKKKICAGITKHYYDMQRRLDTCLSNCRSVGEGYNYEECLRGFYDSIASRATVMPYEYENEITQFSAPPEGDVRLSPTQKRNCEKYKNRCHCFFERKRWEQKIEAAKNAELHAANCKPYASHQLKKKRFKEECERIKNIFPFDLKCAKDGQGRHLYPDCKDACEKCGVK
jgi:hypothetical protein